MKSEATQQMKFQWNIFGKYCCKKMKYVFIMMFIFILMTGCYSMDDEYTNKEITTLEKCSICVRKMKQEENLERLQCKHVFHTDCIQKWRTKQFTCPNCRRLDFSGIEHAFQEIEQTISKFEIFAKFMIFPVMIVFLHYAFINVDQIFMKLSYNEFQFYFGVINLFLIIVGEVIITFFDYLKNILTKLYTVIESINKISPAGDVEFQEFAEDLHIFGNLNQRLQRNFIVFWIFYMIIQPFLSFYWPGYNYPIFRIIIFDFSNAFIFNVIPYKVKNFTSILSQKIQTMKEIDVQHNQ